jgi:hypothetical protein
MVFIRVKQELANFICDLCASNWGVPCVMSEPVDCKPETSAEPDTVTTGKRTIAQVEKWIDMIREMSAEETPELKLPADAVTEQLAIE